MQEPEEKTLDPVVSPLLIGAVHDELRAYDGRRVGDPRPCPGCGATERRKNGYQRARKTFARLVTESGIEDVGLRVQQYECTACGRSYQGDLSALFYEDCEYGKPIVDLCLFHADEESYNACERILHRRYGLQVDRDTVKRYDERFEPSAADLEGVVVGGVRVSLPFLQFCFGDAVEDSPHFVFRSHTALW